MATNPATMVWTRWLRPHSRWAYIPGDVVEMPSDRVEDLLIPVIRNNPKPEGEAPKLEPYIEILTEAKAKSLLDSKKSRALQGADITFIQVRWLKAHHLYAYSPGDVGIVADSVFNELHEAGFVEAHLGGTSVSPEPKPGPVALMRVKFLTYHPNFAYSVGEIGSIPEEMARKLIDSGHVELVPLKGNGFMKKVFGGKNG